LLVLGGKIPDSLSTSLSELFPAGSDIISELHKLHHSPKLVALHEILEECGIGVDASGSEAGVGIGQHRVLIFAQHKVIFTFFFGAYFFRRLINSLLICHLKMVYVQAFLDIIEKDLFQSHMKR
jgi:TATA-binding protein-associated factor